MYFTLPAFQSTATAWDVTGLLLWGFLSWFLFVCWSLPDRQTGTHGETEMLAFLLWLPVFGAFGWCLARIFGAPM